VAVVEERYAIHSTDGNLGCKICKIRNISGKHTRVGEWYGIDGVQGWPLQPLLHYEPHDRTILLFELVCVLTVLSELGRDTLEQVNTVRLLQLSVFIEVGTGWDLTDDVPHFRPFQAMILAVWCTQNLFVLVREIQQIGRAFCWAKARIDIDQPVR